MRSFIKNLPVFLGLLWSTTAFSQISLSLHPDKEEGVFMPEIFGNAQNNRDLAISPDGNEIYSTVVSPGNTFSAIICIKKNAGGWGKPELAPFSGKYSDLEPFFAPGSNRLYFASNRPLSQEGEPKKDFDIWYTELEKGKWSEPKNMGPPINTDKDEFYPSLGNSGSIYFTASYADSKGKEDIYMCKYENGKYAPPVSLDTTINSRLYEFNAYVSPDERTIIYTSFGRSDDKGRGDLYLSTKNDKGEWITAKNLSAANSPFLDYCPFVDWKNRIFYFTSEKSAIKDYYPERLNYKQLIAIFNGSQNGTGSIYSLKLEKILPVK